MKDTSATLARALDGLPPASAASLLGQLADAEVLAVLRRLDLTRAAAVIEAMPADRAGRLTRDLLLSPR